MADQVLDPLSEEERELVLKLLNPITYGDVSPNRLRVEPSKMGSFRYILGEGASARIYESASPSESVVQFLLHQGWLEPDESPDAPEGSYRFTSAALDWFHANSLLTDHEVRKRLGHVLYQRFEQHGDKHPPFDLPAVARQIGVRAERVDVQARLLKKLDYVASHPVSRMYSPGDEASTPPQLNEHLHRLHLTDKGLLWATSGYPEPTMDQATNITVQVEVHLAVTNVIQEAHQAGVPPELLDRFELLMRRLEEELEKPEGQGSFQTVKDVVETASNAKGLLGPLVGFLHEHWDKIQGLRDVTGSVGDLF